MNKFCCDKITCSSLIKIKYFVILEEWIKLNASNNEIEINLWIKFVSKLLY